MFPREGSKTPTPLCLYNSPQTDGSLARAKPQITELRNGDLDLAGAGWDPADLAFHDAPRWFGHKPGLGATAQCRSMGVWFCKLLVQKAPALGLK